MGRYCVIIAQLLAVLAAVPGCAGPAAHRFDVVVYGGTASGAIAAVAAAQQGASVALLEPRRHIGGMVSGGLGATDFGNQAVIGGMSRDFFVRAGRHYGEPIAWHFEPYVAEEIFAAWLKDAGVHVFFDHRLDRVDKKANRIRQVRIENGQVFAAKVFIDCSTKAT